ncbi:MAG: preprotein translocase subunit SecA [Patescibacteria group bacterium]
MLNIFSKLFDEHSKKIKKYQTAVDQINQLEAVYEDLSDEDLKKKTAQFKVEIQSLLKQNKTEAQALEIILPEAFAAVREAGKRTLGLRHYDVQLIAGMSFHYGMITEQKTGEGKTLSATLALYLNSLLEKGTHLVTVNDYLSQIGAGWMGPIYHALDVTVGVIINDAAYLFDPDFYGPEKGDDRLEHFKPITRKEAYAADITYGTNNEFGFDYLRDNMAQSKEDMVQREHYYSIVDEADSILIDEARTPLIISAPDSEPTNKYYDFARLIQSLSEESDFKVDEKMKSVTLTDLGVKRVEQKLGIKNLYEESFDTIHHVESALKAKTLYHRDKEYIVKENEVIIVDEHTGRLMYGRRYSDGLHQAIEAKEGATIQQESRTLATISLQNYFRLYDKLSGMSGTAITESEEFKKIYEVDVLPIPTHRKIVRIDHPDMIYKTTRAKYGAIVQEIAEKQKMGQPVLVGTRSIDHNQIISDYLKRKGIPHEVLNAKNHEREAFIIADAGKKGQITVATNIAGRGVDIVLGGSRPEIKDFTPVSDSAKKRVPDKKAYQKAVDAWEKGHDEVVALGGLHVIGSERHESRRIDNQLRGRSGRQGDPGSSRFYVSLEDEIMRLFGGEQISKVMDFLKIEEDQPIEHGMISKAIESAQIKVEGFFFDQRKRLVEFDDVMNKQREIIYKRRKRLLERSEKAAQSEKTDEQDSLKTEIMGWIKDEIQTLVSMRAPDQFTEDEMDAIVKEFITIIPFDDASQAQLRQQLLKQGSAEAIVDELSSVVEKTYQQREKQLGKATSHQLERYVVLSTLDQMWMDHLDDIQSLRDGIWLRGDKQTVLSEYKKEAFGMFDTLINRIESEVAKRVFRVQVNQPMQPAINISNTREQKDESDLLKTVQQEQKGIAVPKSRSGNLSDLAQAMNKATAVAKPTPGVAQAKIGRNDPCPCGSGKKWKKCGMVNAPSHRG